LCRNPTSFFDVSDICVTPNTCVEIQRSIRTENRSCWVVLVHLRACKSFSGVVVIYSYAYQQLIFHLETSIFLNWLFISELSGNRLRRIEGLRFQGLSSLTTLRLRRNALVELMDGAFWGLSAIETLYENIQLLSFLIILLLLSC